MRRFLFFLLSTILIVSGITSAQTRDRSEIPEEYTWNLANIYPTDADWKTAKDALQARFDEITAFKGKLSKSPQALLQCLELNTFFKKELRRLETYAIMRSDTDTRVSECVAMKQDINQVLTEYQSKAAFIQPEILAINPKVIQKFLQKEKGLATYRHQIDDIQRRKAHLRFDKEEEIIARVGNMASSPENIYTIFTVADFPYAEIQLQDGTKILGDYSGFRSLRTSSNRTDRETAFEQYFGRLGEYRGTIGGLLNAQVQRDIFYADARGYCCSLASALDENNVPVKVYLALIENVSKNLDAFHRYLNIKKRMLGVDTLKYTDLYAPVVEGLDVNFDLAEAQRLNIGALSKLGDDYRQMVEMAFNNRWIDYYPTAGKQTGAYSEGDIYDVHPYILLNFDGSYDAVSTMAHELGHTLHSWYANHGQPYQNAIYSIFVAEVASTLNEILIFDYYVNSLENEDQRLSMLMEYIDGIKSTLFRQTQFAEFELRIHQMAEKGEQLTGDSMTELYKQIVRKYYGHDQGVCIVSDVINYEWADIPHFYMNFYVYQYATSLTASTALAEDILKGDAKAIEGFRRFLAVGASDYPIEILKAAGVDMTGSAPFEKTIAAMTRAMDEVEAILDRKGL